jgi:hypothetical protein
MLTDFSQNLPKFFCESCNFKTDNKKDYNKHLLTAKHSNQCAVNIKETNFTPNYPKKMYMCDICDKEYKSRVGLWKHKKSCTINVYDHKTFKDDSNDKDVTISNNELIKLITELVKGQTGLQESILELCKNGTHNTTNNTNTSNSHNNSHNKSFNLQFFLNETCKNAMNIMDFVDTIQLQLSDLEKVGEIGYIEGISNIIIKNLNKLDVSLRPVHCTDKKREVLYVKDEGAWQKEDDDNKKMRKVVKKIAHKNMRLLDSYKEKYPDCNKHDFKYCEQYNKLIIEAMGGLGGGSDSEKENKIIKNISKNVIIDK